MTLGLSLFLLVSLSSSEYLEQQLDSVMTMGWDINEVSSTIQITLKCQISLGYCSVGLRKTMTDCDMFAALIDKDGLVTVQDYWSRDHGTPRTDAREGGQNDYTVVTTGSGSDANGHILITFTRKLNTGDSWDQQIYSDINSQICWAYKDNRNGWREHSDYDSATFAWATTSSKMYFQKSSGDKEKHGQLMSLAWGCSATIGIGVARYFKQHWWWFYVHFLCLMFSSIATIITSAKLFEDDKYPYATVSDETFLHSRVGMILSSLVIGQVVFGMATSYFKIFTMNTHATLLLNRAHKLVGYALFISGLYNCWVGWDIYGTNGKWLIAIGFILVVLFFGILEIWQVCWRNRITSPSNSLPTYTHLQAVEMIKSGKKLMFADELIINVGHFALSHPGGSFMVNQSIGEDAGKYMVGCSSWGGSHNPYSHSAKAFSMLKSLAIGKVPTPPGYFSKSSPQESVFMNFHIIKQQKLNDHTNLAYFSNENFKMANECESTEWLGKHFMIAYKKNMKYTKRYYSSIFVDITEWSRELGLPSCDSTVKDQGCVKFIYKVYPGGKMTNYIHELHDNEEVMLRGPLGPGLLMKSLEGKYLALGGGTGLVPFLDLVYMAWKKFGSSSKSFTLYLYAFFRNPKDGFALEILQNVAEKCSWLKLRIVTDQDPKKKDIPIELKDIVSGGIDLAWICGPSGFNRSFAETIEAQGIERSKIILL